MKLKRLFTLVLVVILLIIGAGDFGPVGPAGSDVVGSAGSHLGDKTGAKWLAPTALTVPGPGPRKAEASAPKTAWADQIIYMIMTDRFCNGDRRNDQDADPSSPWAYHGGDFQGIIDKLDYIKDLGVTAIWITPVYLNQAKGYHGYWAIDFAQVDTHLGDLKKLKELVDKAHQRGLKVLLDVVVNHTGQDHPWVKERPDWYHQEGNINNWNNQEEVERGSLMGLPDLAVEKPEVGQYLLDNALFWVAATGVDGFRLDTVRHVPKDYWQRYVAAIKARYPDFFFLGEVWHNDYGYLAGYQKVGIDGLMDFPLYNAITKTFAQGAGLDPILWVLQTREIVPHPDFLGVFVDNHDVPRFVTQAQQAGGEPLARLKAALTFAFSLPGLPIIYYGTEVAMEGGKDPDNRRDMVFGANPEMTEFLKRLISIRRSFHQGELGPVTVVGESKTLLALGRGKGSNALISVINAGDQPVQTTLDLRGLDWGEGMSLKDVLGSSRATIQPGEKLTVALNPWEARIYMPERNNATVYYLVVGSAAVLALAGVGLWLARRRRKS